MKEIKLRATASWLEIAFNAIGNMNAKKRELKSGKH